MSSLLGNTLNNFFFFYVCQKFKIIFKRFYSIAPKTLALKFSGLNCWHLIRVCISLRHYKQCCSFYLFEEKKMKA